MTCQLLFSKIMEFVIGPIIDTPVGFTCTGYLVNQWPTILLFYWLN